MHAGRPPASAYLLMTGLCLVWAANQTAIRIAGEGLPPMLRAGLGATVSCLCLTLWCLARRTPVFRLDGTLPWGILAGLLLAGEFLSMFIGLSLTDVSRGVLFIYTAPFVAALGAHWLVPGDRLTALKALGLLSAFAGVCAIFADGLTAPRPGQLVGDALCLTMGILWGFDMLNIKASPLRDIRPERTLFYSLVVSAAVLLLASVLTAEPWRIALTPRVVAAFAYTAVVVQFVSYTALIWCLQRYPAAFVGAFIFLSPIFGVAIAALMLGEQPSPALGLAAALVSLGILCVNWPRRGQVARAAATASEP